ncbi:MAG: DUF5678 domain-containing protein [Solirubrobacteraceae bacterium]
MSTAEQVQAERAFGIELVQYAGRWVAVQDRTVLDNDETLEALLARLNGQRETVEIFKVREDPAAPCG